MVRTSVFADDKHEFAKEVNEKMEQGFQTVPGTMIMTSVVTGTVPQGSQRIPVYELMCFVEMVRE